jgi:hypothetical protein
MRKPKAKPVAPIKAPVREAPAESKSEFRQAAILTGLSYSEFTDQYDLAFAKKVIASGGWPARWLG